MLRNVVVDLIVIGGGLSGLTVAFRAARAGARVLVLESSARFGGQLETERQRGFVVEQGAEGFVAGSEAMQQLAEQLGIAERVVEQQELRSYGFDGNALSSLAPGEAARFLGFQVAAKELGRGIRAFRGGMQDLIDALVGDLASRVTLRTRAAVRFVEPLGEGVRLMLGDGEERAAAVVVATPALPAAGLLEDAFGAPARALRAAALSSSVTVSLAYQRSLIEHPLDASGFVMAENAQKDGFRACAFSSSKLPSRAPSSHALVRLFFRPNTEDLARLDDAAWRERAERSLGAVLPLRGPAEEGWVARWPDALPVFDAEQRSRVAALEQTLASSRVRLAGSAFHGSGIDAAVRSAFRVSDSLA